MARQDRLPFTVSGEYVANRSFRFQGRSYSPGQLFEWRKLSCSSRKLRQLYEGRFISYKDSTQPIVEEGPDEELAEEELNGDNESEETENQTEEGEESDENFMFDPEIHTVVNPEKGAWFIMEGPREIAQIDRKLAKRLVKLKSPKRISLAD